MGQKGSRVHCRCRRTIHVLRSGLKKEGESYSAPPSEGEKKVWDERKKVRGTGSRAIANEWKKGKTSMNKKGGRCEKKKSSVVMTGESVAPARGRNSPRKFSSEMVWGKREIEVSVRRN